MRYEDLRPGDSIITSADTEVWTLVTTPDSLGYATWLCASHGDRMVLSMSGPIPKHYQVCLASREGR